MIQRRLTKEHLLSSDYKLSGALIFGMKVVLIGLYIYMEILRCCSRTVLSKASKIVIFVCVLIKCCVCFDKMFVRCLKMCIVL